MAKKLFRNYNFEFDKNEKKILVTFCNQAIKQMEGDNKFYNEVKAFTSILEKLKNGEAEVKFTKDELTKLEFQLKQNIKYINEQIPKLGFIKRWLYKSLYKQYNNLFTNHFSN